MSDNRTKRRVGAGTVALLAISGLVLGLIVCCLGGWVFLGPVNYFGCGLSSPSGVAAADLVGTYTSSDGARIDLIADGGFVATDIPNPFRDTDVAVNHAGFEFEAVTVPIGGPGTWRLRPADSTVDIEFLAPPPEYGDGVFRTSFGLTGSRTSPALYWYIGDPDSCHIYRMHRV